MLRIAAAEDLTALTRLRRAATGDSVEDAAGWLQRVAGLENILLLEKPTKGQILFEGQDMQAMKAAQLRHLRRNLQIVFQDPYAALDPRMTIGQIIGEPLRVHGEADAAQRLVAMLPQEMRPAFATLLEESDPEVLVLVKAADKLSAHLKCLEELKAGNREFQSAAQQTRAALDAFHLPELDYFLAEFLPAFPLTLDELQADAQA